MGISSSSKTQTQTQTTAPSAYNQPFLNAGTAALGSAYNQAAPIASQASSTLSASLPTLASNITAGSNTLGAANNYDQYVLGGGLLSGNPYLQSQIDATDNSVANKVNTTFSQAGRTGSGANTYALGTALANNESGLRYSDYNNAISNMNTAAANASNLGSSGLAQYLQGATGAVTLPQAAAGSYSGSLGSLIGNYNTTSGNGTTTSNPSAADQIGKGLQIASLLFSDRRLKIDVRKLGEFSDGLGQYAYRYIWGGPEQEGVMADEVAALRPWALGPEVAGFRTVNYGAL